MQPSMMTKQNLKGEVLTLLMFRILLQLNPKQPFLVQFSPFYLLRSTSVLLGLFGLIPSISIQFSLFRPFGPLLSISSTLVYLVQIGPLQSNSDLFGPLRSIHSSWFNSVQLSLIRSPIFYSVHLVQFGPFQSARSLSSYSVQFGPSVQLVQFGPHLSIWFTSVQFGLIRSFSVNFDPLWFIQFILD